MSDVAATIDESGDQQILVTLAFSEKAAAAIRHSGTSNSDDLGSFSLDRSDDFLNDELSFVSLFM